MPRNVAARIAGLSLALLGLCHLHAVAAAESGTSPAPSSTLKLQQTGDAITGRLVDAHAQPIAGAKVAIEAIDIDAATGPTERSLSAAVPEAAAHVNMIATWMAQARAHMDAIARSGINPDRLIFATWNKFPANSLPESNPSALANLLVYYLDHYRR